MPELIAINGYVTVVADYHCNSVWLTCFELEKEVGKINILFQEGEYGKWAELWSFEVDYEYQGKGYGTLLLDSALSIISKSVPVYLCSSGEIARLMYIRRGCLMFFPCYQSTWLQSKLPGRFKGEMWYSGYLPPRQ